MDDFTRGLKKDVQVALGKGSDWDVNPLVVIGLTEAMLDLELTEEQMFKAVRGYVRQLASQIHPDQNASKISDERRGQIFQAFEVLDDRERFSRALAEFRLLKSEDRKEIRLLRESLARAKAEVEVVKAKEDLLQKERRKLDRDKDQFDREDGNRKLVVAALREEANRSAHEVRRAKSQARGWKARYESLDLFTSLTLDDRGLEQVSGVSVFDARWLAIACLVASTHINPKETYEVLGEGGVVASNLHEAMNTLEISADNQEAVIERWKAGFEIFSTPESTGYRGNFIPQLVLLKLSAGRPTCVYGQKSVVAGGRIIGSIPQSRQSVGRRQLTHLIEADSVFKNLSTVLSVGGLAVHGELLKLAVDAGGNRTATRKLNTKLVILGVG